MLYGTGEGGVMCEGGVCVCGGGGGVEEERMVTI